MDAPDATVAPSVHEPPTALPPAALPPQAVKALKAAGIPMQHVGVSVRPVDRRGAPPLLALNEEQPYLLASTAKVVTSLAALRLLGSERRWRSQAYATGPVAGGRVSGDLVFVDAPAGLTLAELRRWFQQMRREGVQEVTGRIVLGPTLLLHEAPPTGRPADGGGADAARTGGGLRVRVAPGRPGGRAHVSISPRPAGVRLQDDVQMAAGPVRAGAAGEGADGCAVYARWSSPPGAGRGATLAVSGRWHRGCGSREVARLDWDPGGGRAAPAAAASPPAAAATTGVVPSAQLVAALWRETGGRLGAGVVEEMPSRTAPGPAWRSSLVISLSQRLQEINKWSLNPAARQLLQSLAAETLGTPASPRAQLRLQAWLRQEGLAADDLQIELGSGQSRNERGKPRAMVQLLTNAWHNGTARQLMPTLPVAGVDGTLAHRLQKSPARGRASLKTGTLRDTRALAGYVTGASGRVYAVALMVNHPRAAASVPALDAIVEWVAVNG